MGPFRTHCIGCDSAYAIFIEAVKRSGQGSSCITVPALTTSMTKEKHASGSSSGLLLSSLPAEKATAHQENCYLPSTLSIASMIGTLKFFSS
jgi:hypothetical protein